MRIPRFSVGAVALTCVLACAAKEPHGPMREARVSPPAAAAPPVTLSIVGTSDLHGHVLGQKGKGGLDVFAGYLANLRAARAKDGGGVVLVDAGDLFQGTLESNLGEGAVVVEMYNALGYLAAAVGNHEFDFGPVGEATTPRQPGDDPRGALAARIGEAKFAFLCANVVDEATGKLRFKPSLLVEVAGVKVGLVGVTTLATPRTTMAANFAGLKVTPLAEALTREARALRQQGAQVIVAMAHEGGKCQKFDDPHRLDSCDPGQDLMPVLAALAPGTIDALVAGHTHQGMAHFVNGIPVVQSWANGKVFGRIDLKLERGKVVDAKIFAPQEIVAGASYEGAPVIADARIAQLAADDLDKARALQEKPLGVTLADAIDRDYDHESEEGNLFVDMMLAAMPGAEVAITNGGGLRADIPAGPLTYGRLYEAYPFDNRFARVRMTGKDLARMVAENLEKDGGILSLGGVRARTACTAGKLEVKLERADGRPIRDADPLVIVTSDFLATGGDKTFAALPAGTIEIVDTPLIRDGIAAALGKRGGTLKGSDFYDPKKPRLIVPGPRPVHCH
jgi:2',3'-cyclic-nucleotide 2'-phosphodiesterase (5'-nucleotidase family)